MGIEKLEDHAVEKESMSIASMARVFFFPSFFALMVAKCDSFMNKFKTFRKTTDSHGF